MEKELRVHMMFYLTMKEGETEEDARNRFNDMMDKLNQIEEQDSSYQIYETEVQEF